MPLFPRNLRGGRLKIRTSPKPAKPIVFCSPITQNSIATTDMSNPTTRIHQQHHWVKLAYKLIDIAAIAFGLLLLRFWQPNLDSDSTVIACLLAIAIYSVAGEFFGLYREWKMAIPREIGCSCVTWIVTLVSLIVLGKISYSTVELSTGALLGWFAFTPIISLSIRIVFRHILQAFHKKGINARGYAIFGATDLGVMLAQNIESSPELGLKFLGFYDDRPESRSVDLPEDYATRLGSMKNLVEHARNGKLDVVFITLPMMAEKRIREVVSSLNDTTASVYIVPDLFTFQLLHSRWMDVNGVPVVSVYENPFYGVDGVLKRMTDVAIAAVALVVAAIPMLLVAAAVKLTSRGPVLFIQTRYGLDGKKINVWKFRSMTVCENGTEVKQATKNDSRLTPIGGFLRKSSLDELPQLINVLMGSMSMVGPRPHAESHNEYYREQIDGYMLRHKVKPGITGLAQVNGYRGETETIDKMEKRVLFDHKYIREWSIWLDLKIILRTFLIVFSRQNAY